MGAQEPQREHDRIGELFLAAGRLPVSERAAFLERECAGDERLRAEVQSLLAQDPEVLGALEARAGAAIVREARELETDGGALPAGIGGYRILRRIGAGGMGIVYEAEQAEPLRRVALKVIRPGFVNETTLRRFRYEAQVLGWLDHPGIARIFEAGTEDEGRGPQPWFAMELVEGEPLGRWVERRKLGLRARLELLARICDALHHAHQKGVIHRDLKPANVLVDAQGQPKVLDFGVARVTERDLGTTTLETLAGELIGTLPYMSPEQIEADPSKLDVRSDVYAIGVIAYEMLGGRLPHDVEAKRLAAAARTIVEEEPTRLGTLDARLRGDVETIVAKAIEKDPDRRYASAEELANDLRRFLEDEPIRARPPSAVYQLRKFARRNRGLVAGVVMVIVVLAAATGVSWKLLLDTRAALDAEKVATDEANAARTNEQHQRRRAERATVAEREQRERAEENSQAADRVSEFLVDLFQVPDTNVEWGESITARELLDRGVRDIGDALRDQPRIRARLMRTLGRVYGNLGLYADARPLLEDALALHREQGDPDEIAASLYRLGTLDRLAGDYTRGEASMREAYDLLADAGHTEGEAFARVLDGLAGLQTLRGEYEAAVETADRALALATALHGENSLEASFPLATVATIHQERDEWDEARSAAERVLEIRQAHLDDEDPDLVSAMSLLGVVRYEQGDTAAALAIAREVYAIKTRRLPEDHPGRVSAMHDLAAALKEYGEPREAEKLMLEVRDRTRELYGERNPRYADSLHALGSLQHELSEFGEAEANLREALDIREETLGPDHPLVASTLNMLGMTLTLGARRPEEAIPLLERALEIARAKLGGPERATTASIMGNLANALGYAGRYDEALDMHLQLLDLYRELRGPAHEDVARTLHNISLCVLSQGDPARALEYAEECREVQDAILPENHPSRAFNCDAIGRCLLQLGQTEEAEASFRRGLAIREASLPPDHVALGESLAMVAYCLSERGAYAEAEPLLLRALEICEANYPPTDEQMRYVLARLQNLYRAWGRTDEAERYLERYEAAGGRPGSGE